MEDILVKIDKYWRACNFLTVSNMYLKSNRFLTRELEDSDLKEFASGHWGTCPGINFIYAHLNRFINQYKRKTQLVIGPGHGGNALLANLQMEDSVSRSFVNIEISEDIKISKEFSSVRTEVTPFCAGTIYDGGELGYSLPVAFGAVLDRPHNLCVCIIGDGEAETGTIAASWNCKELLNNKSGFVLPIIHLNGYRMGEPSLLASRSDKDILLMCEGMGYHPLIVKDSHEDMYRALDCIESIYKKIENGAQERWPILVLRTNKGWTAPDLDGIHIEGTLRAHKNPLRGMDTGEQRRYLTCWLESYQPDELFIDGKLCEDALSIIPEPEYRLGNTLHRYQKKRLQLPNIDDFMLEHKRYESGYSNICILNAYMGDVIKKNPRIFRIFSPDELQSNLLGELKKTTFDLAETNYENESVIEILNENVCQGLMQGYNLTGRNGIMVGYEAFMQIISSMVSQYAKWIFQSDKVEWRCKPASMTYLLTSLCWSNTYSHQNPEFINSLLNSEFPFVRIYMPVDANSLLACMEKCLKSEGNINAIIVSKQKMPQWLEPEKAKDSADAGVVNWHWLNTESEEEPDILIVAAGDYPVRECIKAIYAIKNRNLNIKIKFISITELTCIGSSKIYPHALSQEEFVELFCKDIPIVFCFHGYPSAIKTLLHGRINSERLIILGYKNKSIFSCSDLDKMIINDCSRYNIELECYRVLCKYGKLNLRQYQKLRKEIIGIIRQRMDLLHD